MRSSLTPHLERISISLDEIGTYAFPDSRIFANALLKSHDIVTFIRDTEAHEKALFVPVTTQGNVRLPSSKADIGPSNVPHRNPTVYSVLGGDMVGRIRKGFTDGSGLIDTRGDIGDVDVDILLLGAEKLTSVYQIPQAKLRIARARARFEELSESLSNYGALVASQRTQLNLLNRLGVDDSVENFDSGDDGLQHVTDKMIEEQESLIRDLEERKDTLEHKVKQIDQKMNTLYRSI